MSLNISTAFYDAMFPSSQTDETFNALEDSALSNVREILNSPDKLSSRIPPLPVTLLQLIDALKDSNTDFIEIAKIIDKDPSLAIEVLKVVNSGKYYGDHGEIHSLSTAIGLLGVKGVSNIATTIMMEKIRPAAPIYFKKFGKQIWGHSVQCAYICQLIAQQYNHDEFDAHFVGLIHDVGKIIIFNCLCEALSTDSSQELPGSMVFKELMSEMSTDISTFIAEEWKLPEIYRDALRQQRIKKVTPLAKTLFQADKLSEIYLLFQQGKVTQDIMNDFVAKTAISEERWDDFLLAAPEIEAAIT